MNGDSYRTNFGKTMWGAVPHYNTTIFDPSMAMQVRTPDIHAPVSIFILFGNNSG